MSDLEYELWDMESANRLGAFATRREALSLVDEMLRCDGPEAVATLALGAVCRTALGDVELRPIMDGSELIAELSAKPKVS
jgi:hypothetical protein